MESRWRVAGNSADSRRTVFRKVAGKSPERRQKVTEKSPECPRNIARKLPESRRKVTGKSPESRYDFLCKQQDLEAQDHVGKLRLIVLYRLHSESSKSDSWASRKDKLKLEHFYFHLSISTGNSGALSLVMNKWRDAICFLISS